MSRPSPTDDRQQGAISRAFAVAVILNSIYVVAEFGYGFVADSVALLADAAHNLSDVLGLLLAWGASRLARRAPGGRRTYGLRKSTVLAALANAVLLIAATGGLVWEAIERLANPPEPAAKTMMLVAGLGVIVNSACAWLLLRSGHGHGHAGHGHAGHGHAGHDHAGHDHAGHDHAGHDHAEHEHGHDHAPPRASHDLNLRGAFVHLAADAAVSVGVVLTGLLLLQTGWRWLDPAVSLVIALVIVIGTWSILREALDLALDAAPKHIDLDGVRGYLLARPGVLDVHDLHVWALGTSDVALTAHLVVETLDPALVVAVERELGERFGIAHTTLQLEPTSAVVCPQQECC